MAVLLRLAAIAVGRAARIDHVDVRDLVQVGPQRRHGRVHLAQVARLLCLGVGLVGHADIQVEGRLAEFGQRLAADEPAVGGDVLHRDGDDRQRLAQHALRELGDRVDGLAGEGGVRLAGEVDDDVRHGELLFGVKN
ncbi:hypothetical protein D3C72_2055310 [compost metagenome]